MYNQERTIFLSAFRRGSGYIGLVEEQHEDGYSCLYKGDTRTGRGAKNLALSDAEKWAQENLPDVKVFYRASS